MLKIKHKKENTKKILQIIPSMCDGGAQRVFYDYIKNEDAINGYDFDFLVLSPRSGSIYDIAIQSEGKNVKYLDIAPSKLPINILRKISNMVRRIAAIQMYINEKKPEGIHTHMSGIMRDMLVPLALFQGIKFHTMHSNPYSYSKQQSVFTKIAFKFLNVHPVAVGNEQMKKAIKCYGINNCDLLQNSVDIGFIRKEFSKTSKLQQRKLYGLPVDGFIIGSVGRLHPVKNYDGLIRIFAKYRNKNPNAYLVIAGDGSEKKYLTELMVELGVEEYVFLVGNINQYAIYKFYRGIDRFVMTSHSEAAPMVFLEAQAVGIRCIVGSSIDSNMVYRDNVRIMQPGASIEDWCVALHDDKYVNNYFGSCKNFDMKTLMSRLANIYDKYFEE